MTTYKTKYALGQRAWIINPIKYGKIVRIEVDGAGIDYQLIGPGVFTFMPENRVFKTRKAALAAMKKEAK